jgi:xanthine/CO dehydrogenase XdhC/CoxF family maturation factor
MNTMKIKMLYPCSLFSFHIGDVFIAIGTPIGAESPEEIALSIATELVCVRRKGNQQAKALRKAIGSD